MTDTLHDRIMAACSASVADFEQLGKNVAAIGAAAAAPIGVGLRDSIVKLGGYVTVSRELLYPTTPSTEDASRWRAEREAREARQDARHAELLTAGGVVAAIAGLHSPDEHRSCEGCDYGGYEAEAPEWPCRTWDLLDEQHGGAPCRP